MKNEEKREKTEHNDESCATVANTSSQHVRDVRAAYYRRYRTRQAEERAELRRLANDASKRLTEAAQLVAEKQERQTDCLKRFREDIAALVNRNVDQNQVIADAMKVLESNQEKLDAFLQALAKDLSIVKTIASRVEGTLIGMGGRSALAPVPTSPFVQKAPASSTGAAVDIYGQPVPPFPTATDIAAQKWAEQIDQESRSPQGFRPPIFSPPPAVDGGGFPPYPAVGAPAASPSH